MSRDSPELGEPESLRKRTGGRRCSLHSLTLLRRRTSSRVAEAKPTSSGAAKIARSVLYFPIASIYLVYSKIRQREHSASIVNPPATYEQESPAKKKNIIQLDCRGLEFVEFKADGEWLAKGLESGTTFSGIDLSEGEWFDYDEKAGEEVSIKDLSWEIRRS
ncbi:MAG: hypothetical protein M1821_000692 [Bathelium mastoideum]|nr:MAG: hypothetical protein M1821_000692 [Bathelium mastoideum]